jgi:formylglycine-generating enzyme required for sulfatase activity
MDPMIRPALVSLALAINFCSSGVAQPKRGAKGMARLAGGTFVMGTDPSRVDGLCRRFGTTHRDLFLPEVPAHTVNLPPFSIDRTEVANVDFKTFVDSHPEWAPGRVPAERHNGDYLKHWRSGTFPSGAADVPVTYVTWWAAKAYCESSGNRLPTEAEWEFAARGGLASAEFPWGDEPPDARRANWSGTGLGAPTRVGRYRPNAYGLYDMAGNVWEFVEEPWTDDYSRTPPSPLPQDRHVIRGGSYGGGPINLRVRYRDSHPAGGAGPHVGFRCARSDNAR